MWLLVHRKVLRAMAGICCELHGAHMIDAVVPQTVL